MSKVKEIRVQTLMYFLLWHVFVEQFIQLYYSILFIDGKFD